MRGKLDRDQLLAWLDEHDHFAISMGEDDESPTPRLRRMKEIVEQIESELRMAAAKIRSVGSRWGVGDSYQDEKIANRLFDLLHFRVVKVIGPRENPKVVLK